MDFLRKNTSYKYSIIIAVVLLILTVGGGVAFKSAQEDISDNTVNESTEALTEASDSAKVSKQEDSKKEDTTKKEETTNESTTTNSETTGNTSSGGSSSDDGSTSQPPPATSGELLIVTISGSGFSPSTITINVGDTVKWVNNDNRSHWPASDPHPQHTGYLGFDPKTGIGAGSNWSFKFNSKGTWDYHDHQFPNKTGTVVVE